MAGSRIVVVAGTADTKAAELLFVKEAIEAAGMTTTIVDLSTRPWPGIAGVSAAEVASHHPDGPEAVFTGDRGRSVAAMAVAFERFLLARENVAGIIGLGGSGGTALITPAMRALPVGVPKLMVSTVASSNVAPFVGASDVTMMYSVTDLAGLNRISRIVLANAAHAIAGMARSASVPAQVDKAALGLTMFGVTTPLVNALVADLQTEFDCLVFHATGTGGQSMEKLAASGLLAGVIDATTTEVCDLLVGGVFACTEERFGAFVGGTPYVGSCGALDMVNFGAIETVPAKYRGRNLYVHNPQVTLMRTTVDENRRIGEWIGKRLNAMPGEVRFFIPEGGVSALDAPGMPFYDEAADRALFDALEATVVQTDRRRLIRRALNINDPAFAAAMAVSLRDIMPGRRD